MTCSDPEIVGVNGSLITGLMPGETEVTVYFQNDRPSAYSWKVRVQPAGQAAGMKLQDHPRILFSEEELEEFRERIKPGDGSSARIIDASRLWEEYLSKADAYVVEKLRGAVSVHIGSVEGNAASDGAEAGTRTARPYLLPVLDDVCQSDRGSAGRHVHGLPGDGREEVRGSSEAASAVLAAFGKWYEFDERGAEGNLSNAHLLLGASSAYDAIHSLLTEEERRSIRQAILENGLHPLAIDIGSRDMHNIVAAKQVAMVYGAAAIMDENPFAAKYLQAGLTYLQSYLDRKGGPVKQRGCCTTMWLRAMPGWRRIFIGESAAMTAWFSIRICGKSFLNVFRLLAPGEESSFPNLSDSFYKLDIAYLMAMTATHYDHPAAVWYLHKHAATHHASLLYLRKETSPASPTELYGARASAVFQSVGWAALRSGWGDEDHLLCFTSSSSAKDHNHKDQNNLVINAGGEWLLTNPGYQDYVPGPKADYTTGTVGHNSLLVNGQGRSIWEAGVSGRNCYSRHLRQLSGTLPRAMAGC